MIFWFEVLAWHKFLFNSCCLVMQSCWNDLILITEVWPWLMCFMCMHWILDSEIKNFYIGLVSIMHLTWSKTLELAGHLFCLYWRCRCTIDVFSSFYHFFLKVYVFGIMFGVKMPLKNSFGDYSVKLLFWSCGSFICVLGL